jgi:hypothetical protein
MCTGFFKFGDLESGATMNLKVIYFINIFSLKQCQHMDNLDIKLVNHSIIMTLELKLIIMVNLKKLF